jgi:ERCC4-type nuclease
MGMRTPPLVIIQDTREQAGWGRYFTCEWEIETISVGDYTARGVEHLISLERKSLPDLLGSLTHDRDRFERELAKARAYQKFFVVIEASATDVLEGNYGRFGANINPTSIWETVATFSTRYAPFIFADNPGTAARYCESILGKFVRELFVNCHRVTHPKV